MLAKSHSANILRYPTSHSLDTKVVIATRIRLQDILCHYVCDNKFAALKLVVFEELTFDCRLYPLKESPKNTPIHIFVNFSGNLKICSIHEAAATLR